VSSSEVSDHWTETAEGKRARERSGGYADPLPCEKRPLSNGSRVINKVTFLSWA
jgi:hypothetical protein